MFLIHYFPRTLQKIVVTEQFWTYEKMKYSILWVTVKYRFLHNFFSSGSETFDEVQACFGSSDFADCFISFGSLVEDGGREDFFKVLTNLYFSVGKISH